jgi:hypothetical protein
VKLTDLEPRWVGADGQKFGLTFDCPHCRVERIGVAFHHAGHELMEDAVIHARCPNATGDSFGGHIWTVTGDTFESLTLTPSVDASRAGHWHGFVTNGETA